jgi:choline dehydrogenase-like flavoprotein
MIIDIQQLADSSEIGGSIAIVGCGAAGITLAIELTEHFKDVVLLESGGLEFEQETQRLCEGTILGHAAGSLDTSRLRFFGGTTNHWNGQCAPLDAIDFEPIEGRAFSGWPFSKDEFIPFYRRAYGYCELGEYQSASRFIEDARPTVREMIDSDEFELTEFRFSPPTRFGQRYRAQLQSSDRLKIYLHANVTDIAVADNGGSVTALEARTLAGKKFRVKASAYVLCCGGIENPRILLNCTRYFPTGVGNGNDLVGRFFMDHLAVFGIGIAPQIESFDYRLLAVHLEGTIRVKIAFKNSVDVVRKPGRRGCSLILGYDLPEHLESAFDSPAYKAFQQFVRYARLKKLPPNMLDTGCAVLDDPRAIAAMLGYRLSERAGMSTVPKAIEFHLEGEQAPNPTSRVLLTDAVDALGVRRAGLDWRISRQDRDNLYESAMALARGIGAAGSGRVVVPMLANEDQSMIQTAWHHMGTTRMHDDPKQGVVDRHCRVHGLANFFIAGSSVFPTGGRVNPTLTIVALAVRLADHLKATVKRA